MEVGAREQRVVVEHLLEMGDCPGAIDAVAREPATEHVANAAASHRVQRAERHRALAAQEQELDGRGRRELGRTAEATVARVVAAGELAYGVIERLLADGGRGRLEAAGPGEALAQAGAAGADLLAILAPRRRDGLEHLGPGG